MTRTAESPAVQQPLLPWTLSFLRPYRGRVSLLAVLLTIEIGFGALQPWPLALVIDHVLDRKPLSGRPGPNEYGGPVVFLTAGRSGPILVGDFTNTVRSIRTRGPDET